MTKVKNLKFCILTALGIWILALSHDLLYNSVLYLHETLTAWET